MKNLNDKTIPVCRDVPPALDERILAAARNAARNRRRIRFIKPWFWSVTAAAAGTLIAAGAFLYAPVGTSRDATRSNTSRGISESELLALNDWSDFEQKGYILMKSVGSCSQDLSDWNREFTQEL